MFWNVYRWMSNWASIKETIHRWITCYRYTCWLQDCITAPKWNDNVMGMFNLTDGGYSCVYFFFYSHSISTDRKISTLSSSWTISAFIDLSKILENIVEPESCVSPAAFFAAETSSVFEQYSLVMYGDRPWNYCDVIVFRKKKNRIVRKNSLIDICHCWGYQ